MLRRITQHAAEGLHIQLASRNFERNFHDTLYIIAGLLRRILDHLERPATQAGSKPVKIIVVRELLKYLEGDEGDPRLLQVIDSMG